MSATILETHTGRYIDYADPQPEAVSIHDIAHALSNVCRYGGHSTVFYSVAEHALLCERLLADAGAPRWVRLAGLHHDSHEAYLGDVPTPLKRALSERVEDFARAFDRAIGEALRVDWSLFRDPRIQDVDLTALGIEVKRLKRSRGESPYWQIPDVPVPDYFNPGRPPADVEHDFYWKHVELGGRV